MRQLVFLGAGEAAWRDTAAPTLDSPTAALVRPLVVSTCDMDAVAMSGLVRFRGPIPLGHECVAEVLATGQDVTTVEIGDRVIVPWQISCGTCGRCQRGQDAHCTSVAAGSCYGWGPHVDRWAGFLADVVLVPYADHMLVPAPAGIDPASSCGLSDNIVDAWRAAGPPLEETSGSSVLVVGSAIAWGGSIGLYTAMLARILGAPDVVYASHIPEFCRQAAAFDIEPLLIQGDFPRPARTFDVTIDTSGLREGLHFALQSTGKNGVCTCTAGAVHRGADTPLPVYDMYMNAVTFRTGWAHTRSLMPGALELVASGRFDQTALARITPWEDAGTALSQPFTKLIFDRRLP